jgi:hypothetical protein
MGMYLPAGGMYLTGLRTGGVQLAAQIQYRTIIFPFASKRTTAHLTAIVTVYGNSDSDCNSVR